MMFIWNIFATNKNQNVRKVSLCLCVFNNIWPILHLYIFRGFSPAWNVAFPDILTVDVPLKSPSGAVIGGIDSIIARLLQIYTKNIPRMVIAGMDSKMAKLLHQKKSTKKRNRWDRLNDGQASSPKKVSKKVNDGIDSTMARHHLRKSTTLNVKLSINEKYQGGFSPLFH